MALLQQDRLVNLNTPLGPDALLVETLEGTEAISSPFRFQLVLVSEKRDLKIQDLVGQRVTIEFELAGKKRRPVNGFVSRFSQGDVDSKVAHYYAEVVPWLWFLSRANNCRIFQRKTVPDIIQQIFKDRGFTDFKMQLQGTFEPREYCVQYRESDLNFISRLAEEEGIFYFFEHTDSKHTMMIGNDPGIHKELPNQPKARYAYLLGGNQEVDAIARWHLEQEVHPGKVTLRDYHFLLPGNEQEVSAPSGIKVPGNDKLELFDYPGYFAKRFDGEGNTGKIRPDGERTAKLDMQAEEAFHKTVSGAGSCRAFIPGYKFELIEHRRADLNGPYVITSVSHSASNNLGSGEGAVYDNTFGCIPMAVPFRPARVTPNPVMRGAQTAVVVGTPGEEIDTDKHGRVKVQFHWDREGKKNQDSSCWVRVSQPWAGKGFGMVHIPRIGQEVVVEFLEGDPDQPLIIGSVYNAEQTPPFPLPASKMVMGLKSNTTPGGGGNNEISLNDTKGKELINIHGQYDMKTVVEHDQTTTVHNNRTDAIDVDDSETVGSNQKIKIGSKQTVDIGSDQEIKIGSNQKLTVGSNQEFQIGADQKETVGAKRDVSISADDTLAVGGKQTVGVTGAIAITSDTSIELTVADSGIKIEPGKITISTGGTVLVEGATKVEVKGAMIVGEATGVHELKGATIKLN